MDAILIAGKEASVRLRVSIPSSNICVHIEEFPQVIERCRIDRKVHCFLDVALRKSIELIANERGMSSKVNLRARGEYARFHAVCLRSKP